MEHRSRFVIHRGLRHDQRTPNALEGVVRAEGHGIECDVFLLRDGGMGVVHNTDVGLSQEQIEQMNTPEFHRLMTRERGTEQERFAAPTLEEMLFQAHDRGTRLMIELKASNPRKAEELGHALIIRMNELIQEGAFARSGDQGKGYIERFVGIHSFSPEGLFAAVHERFRQKLNIQLGLFWASTYDRAGEMKISATAQQWAANLQRSAEALRADPSIWASTGVLLAQRMQLQSFSPHESLVTPELVINAHQRGIEIAAWVVNKPERIRELSKMGVDTIITEVAPR